VKTEQGFLVIASEAKQSLFRDCGGCSESVQRLLRDSVPRNDMHSGKAKLYFNHYLGVNRRTVEGALPLVPIKF